MKRVAYGKIGRVIEVDSLKWGQNGGDNEAPQLLLTLADRNPDTTFVCTTRNSGWAPPRPNIENPWQEWMPEVKANAKKLYGNEDQSLETLIRTIQFYDDLTMQAYDKLDGVIMWVGQHGSTSMPLPTIKDRTQFTQPQISAVAYSSHALRGINFWRREAPTEHEEIWLLADVRNHLKARDLKWPRKHPILAQYEFSRNEKMERFGDLRTPQETGFEATIPSEGLWSARDRYTASGLELVGLPDPRPLTEQPGWEERRRFGIIINENRNYGMRKELTRLDAMQRYILPLQPDFIHGNWTKKSLETLGMEIKSASYDGVHTVMEHVKSTFTTPASGSGWATAKPWESFATGTICFFHPYYDTQGNIIPTLDQLAGPHADLIDDELANLARWLRVSSPEELTARVNAVESDRATYEWLAGAQYRYLQRELELKRCVTAIEERLK